jgi:hypothetical protein
MKTLITNKFSRAFAVILLLTLSGGAIANTESVLITQIIKSLLTCLSMIGA